MKNEIMKTIFDGINIIQTDIRSRIKEEKQHEDCIKIFTDSFIILVSEQYELFQLIYDNLYDAKSKEIYLQEIKRRILYAYFPKFTADEFINKIYTAKKHRYDIIDYKTEPSNILNDFIANDVQTFILNAYIDDEIYKVSNCNVIFDIGSYNGMTAINFSSHTNGLAKVYTVEPEENLFNNVCANTKNIHNIIPINIGFSNKTKNSLFTTNDATSKISESGNSTIQLETIDDFVVKKDIKELNLIKMDIEGEELRALRGSITTLNRFKPILVICIYHNHGEDLLTIPLFLLKTKIYKNFYIRKYHISDQETVLFAIP